MASRFVELDALRGVGIGIMILYHTLFDWNFFFEPFDLSTPFWFWLARGGASIFILLAGISMVLYAHRHPKEKWKSHAKRGALILGLGLVITLFTWIFFPTYTIWFGVLHLIGSAIVLSTPLLTRPKLAWGLGLFVLGAGIVLSIPPFFNVLQIPGLLPVAMRTFDYFPLFPWLGMFWVGMGLSHVFYPKGKPHSFLGWKNSGKLTQLLAFAGRNSLLIYFIHQPLVFGILFGLHALI